MIKLQSSFKTNKWRKQGTTIAIFYSILCKKKLPNKSLEEIGINIVALQVIS